MESFKIFTFVITCFGVYIAYSQYRINRYKVKLDLYEKRYKVVQGYKKAIANVLTHGNLTTEDLNNFLITTKESTYLFGDDITKHLDSVYEKFVNLQLYNTEINENRELEQSLRTEYAHNKKDILIYFNKLIAEADKKFFKKYLDFSKLN